MTNRIDRWPDQLKEIRRGRQTVGIFELSDLFGITTEALRKYEAKRILQPYREENGYRRYCSWDLTKIICLRQLRQEGFSLGEISKLLEMGDSEARLKNLNEMQRKLEEEIAYRQKLIRWIRSHRDEIVQSEKQGNCVLEKQKKQYCCVYLVGDTLVDKKEQEWSRLKEWVRAEPFVRVCYVGDRMENVLSCLTLNEEEMEQYDLRHLTPDFVIPECSGIACNVVVEHGPNRDTMEETIRNTREKAERKAAELGVCLTGGMFIQMLWYLQRNNVFYAGNKVVFPVN